MTDSIAALDRQGFRKFGLTTGAIVAVLFGLLIPWLFELGYPKWPWIVAVALAAGALLMPMALKPVYYGWMKFGHIMNWINTRLILGILFYVVFLPIGAMMRLFGWDPMNRKLDKSTQTYRVPSQQESRDNVERPY